MKNNRRRRKRRKKLYVLRILTACAALVIGIVCLFRIQDVVFSHDRQQAASSGFPAKGTSVTLLYQTDPAWSRTAYGDGTIGTSGCAPTVMAMALGLSSPEAIARWADEQGYYEPGAGTQWAFIPAAAQAAGTEAWELALDQLQVCQALDAGCSVVVCVGPGDFTTTGHFLLLTGYDPDGFILQDPNSPERTGMIWNWQQLAGQIRCLWSVGPL